MKKKTKMRVQGTTCKEQIPLPNIHFNKGKYPQSGKEIYNFSIISDIHYPCLCREAQTITLNMLCEVTNS